MAPPVAPSLLDRAQAALHRVVHYRSTYCLHRLHDDCRLTCVICNGPCWCWCHRTERRRLQWDAWLRSFGRR